MLTFLTVLYILSALLLIIAVLLQSNKGTGLGILGGSSDTLLGSSSADFMTKFTSSLGAVFMIGAVVLSIMSAGTKSLIDKDENEIAKPAEQKVLAEPGITNILMTNLPPAD